MKLTTNNTLNKLLQILKNKLDSLPSINDSTPSATSVYSSNKVNTSINAITSSYRQDVDIAITSFTQNSSSDN